MAKKRKKTKPLMHFFLDGKLYKKLRINRPADMIEVWCYPEERRVVLTYSEVRRRYQPAFSTAQVAEMIGRNDKIVERIARSGNIEEPTMAYSLTKKMYRSSYKWSETDIMNLHAYLLTVHRGRPRLDGRITPQAMPTAKELRALIRQEHVLYVRNDDGEFVPSWRA
jgi:hypothetical protein